MRDYKEVREEERVLHHKPGSLGWAPQKALAPGSMKVLGAKDGREGT